MINPTQIHGRRMLSINVSSQDSPVLSKKSFENVLTGCCLSDEKPDTKRYISIICSLFNAPEEYSFLSARKSIPSRSLLSVIDCCNVVVSLFILIFKSNLEYIIRNYYFFASYTLLTDNIITFLPCVRQIISNSVEFV